MITCKKCGGQLSEQYDIQNEKVIACLSCNSWFNYYENWNKKSTNDKEFYYYADYLNKKIAQLKRAEDYFNTCSFLSQTKKEQENIIAKFQKFIHSISLIMSDIEEEFNIELSDEEKLNGINFYKYNKNIEISWRLK